jgi:putative intracellular protease/amidase
VNIAATDAAAAEAGSDPAVFTISRTAGSSLGMPLMVNYRASGTAVAGSDYALLSGSVMIPAGVPSATITVTPIDDVAAEGRETVAIALLAGTGYTLGTQTSATANIADNDAAALPVLMVIANRDFYYQEYADTRASLEAAGLRVEVAAATRTLATPHANSGQGTSAGTVMPDLAIADANAANYSSVVFVGGWGASSFQHAFSGTYANTAYNGSPAAELVVNQLIGDFVRQDKYITGICHGVTVLAWARVEGASPLAGRRVSSYAGGAPTSDVPGSTSTRWHIEQNGATMVGSRSIGNPTTATDDVLVDGKLITAENWDSAAHFGRTLADYLIR